MRLLEKYMPRSIGAMIGNRKQAAEVMNHALRYRKGVPLLIYGAGGSGKNLAVELVAKEIGYELVELTAADMRNYEKIRGGIIASSKQSSLFSKGKIILVDDLDISDSGMKKGLSELIKESAFPVIFIAENPFSKKLFDIRKASRLLRFDKIRYDSIRKLLETIARNEGIEYDDKSITQLARIADGDVRSAIIDMESLGKVTEHTLPMLSHRVSKQPVFDTLKIMLKVRSLSDSMFAIDSSDKEPEELFWWLEENIHREYESPDDMAQAYFYLAYADYFRSLIARRQNWVFLKHFISMMSCISIAKKHTYRKFVSYRPPDMRVVYGKRMCAERKLALEKLARLAHTSTRLAESYVPLIKMHVKDSEFLSKTGLSCEEIKALAS